MSFCSVAFSGGCLRNFYVVFVTWRDSEISGNWELVLLVVGSLVHKKNNYCKKLAKFLQSKHYLQNSGKKYRSCKISQFESKSCKILATSYDTFSILAKNFARVVSQDQVVERESS